ncbi:MAG: transcriptional repressor LexA [Bdellovibrionales bacterium]|nr:transcriptional repressor LexA [Bdellovibrionales bacterium]
MTIIHKTNIDQISPKQRQVFDFIEKMVESGEGFPTLQVIGDHLGVSRNTAKFHVKALEKKGFIGKREQRVSDFFLPSEEEGEWGDLPKQSAFRIPLVAEISAGAPEESFDQKGYYVAFDQDFFGRGDLKALRVSGNSMTGDSICDGDLAIVNLQKIVSERHIVAVRIEGEGITLKRIKRGPRSISLIPSNPEYKTREYDPQRVEVMGRLVGVVRKTS